MTDVFLKQTVREDRREGGGRKEKEIRRGERKKKRMWEDDEKGMGEGKHVNWQQFQHEAHVPGTPTTRWPTVAIALTSESELTRMQLCCQTSVFLLERWCRSVWYPQWSACNFNRPRCAYKHLAHAHNILLCLYSCSAGYTHTTVPLYNYLYRCTSCITCTLYTNLFSCTCTHPVHLVCIHTCSGQHRLWCRYLPTCNNCCKWSPLKILRYWDNS